jgi:hypothetical protein
MNNYTTTEFNNSMASLTIKGMLRNSAPMLIVVATLMAGCMYLAVRAI